MISNCGQGMSCWPVVTVCGTTFPTELASVVDSSPRAKRRNSLDRKSTLTSRAAAITFARYRQIEALVEEKRYRAWLPLRL